MPAPPDGSARIDWEFQKGQIKLVSLTWHRARQDRAEAGRIPAALLPQGHAVAADSRLSAGAERLRCDFEVSGMAHEVCGKFRGAGEGQRPACSTLIVRSMPEAVQEGYGRRRPDAAAGYLLRA